MISKIMSNAGDVLNGLHLLWKAFKVVLNMTKPIVWTGFWSMKFKVGKIYRVDLDFPPEVCRELRFFREKNPNASKLMLPTTTKQNLSFLSLFRPFDDNDAFIFVEKIEVPDQTINSKEPIFKFISTTGTIVYIRPNTRLRFGVAEIENIVLDSDQPIIMNSDYRNSTLVLDRLKLLPTEQD